MIMGVKNRSAIDQEIFSRILNDNLPAESHEAIVNFQDDFLGFDDTVDGLMQHFEAFLQCCRKGGIKLNPAKVHVGVRNAKFYGYTLSAQGMGPTEANLDPVRKMTATKNVSQVRSILGVFNQFSIFYKRYDRITKPLVQLTKKGVPFHWGPEQAEALQTLRERVLKGDCYLSAVRKDVPLILETDGSDDGWVGILLQEWQEEVKNKRHIIKMWGKQWKTVSMRKAPPYYKECVAWMRGLEMARVYADTHPLPVL